MKKRKFYGSALSILFALLSLTSCKSAETAVGLSDTRETAFSGTTAVPTGNFSGIILENVPSAADTTVTFTEQNVKPVPSESDEPGQTDDTTVSESESVTETTPDMTTASVTAAQTSSRQTTPADTTVSAAPQTTTKAPATTTTAAAAPVTTTTETTTAAASTAAETTATTVTTTAPAETTTTAAPSGYTGGGYAKNSYTALNHSYVKAMWISYIELGALYGKDEAGFRSGFAAMLDNCASLGINTVYVHVRAFGDAYYYSELFPFTKKMNGVLGKRTAYDPLKIMVSEAHARNISFHAWINPLRLGNTQDMAATPSSTLVGKWYSGSEKGKYVVSFGGNWYLNPGYPEVRKLIGDGVREIVSGYNVDGVHIDDYYYPPNIDTSFDSDAFTKYGSGNLSTFRVNSINVMVKEIYTAAHECGTAIFGASPQGNNYNNLYGLYADTKAWCSGGYIDYFTPQVYYGFNNGGVPYKSNVNEWLGIVKGTKTKLYIGLAVYKAGNEDKWAGVGKNEWQNTDTMLKRQTEYANEAGCSGIALYSYDYIFTAGKNTRAMTKEIENLKPLLAN